MTGRYRVCAAGFVAWLALTLAGGPVTAETSETDAERQAWRYRRLVDVPSGEQPFHALQVPPEVAARAQADLQDLRLVTSEGVEVPFVVDRLLPRDREHSFVATLSDARREPLGPPDARRSRSTWVLDLAEARTFDTLTLRIDARDFVKRMRLEASDDGSAWRLLLADAGVFDLAWTPRIHHTRISLPAPETARYLRLTTENDRESLPVEVTGADVARRSHSEGVTWERAVTYAARAAEATTRYRLELPGSFPLERLSLDAADAAFARQARVLAVSDGEPDRLLGEALVYRVALPDADASGAQLSIPVTPRPGAEALVLEVTNGDSPPLRELKLTASGTVARLLYPAQDREAILYYGNALTRAPLYDLEPLRERLALSGAISEAGLGPESENPAYGKPTPLPLAPLRGAPLEASAWRWSRTLDVPGAEDLYALTLAPTDLGMLRPDLGDLRLVDAEGLQLPYVLEPSAEEAFVDLTSELEARDESTAGGTTSRYRLLVPPVVGGESVALPLRRLEVDVAEPLFDRTVRVLVDAARGERVVASGRLRRLAETDGLPRLETLGLDGSRVAELVLQVDEGDNAPLTLRGVRAVVSAPRVTFKAAAGRYHLLLGNPEAQAPRYDLGSLRRQVLAYSALPIVAAPADANAAFRRSASDYLRDAPPTLLLWGTLVAAVIALLWLTTRAIRGSADE